MRPGKRTSGRRASCATRPSTLEALTVEVDPADTHALRRDWIQHEVPIPLKIIASPYREITRPVIDYVKSLRAEHPRTVIIVYVPEYVVGHWYEQVLHNQSALRLRVRLHFIPGVMVASVPWQLRSSEGAEEEWYDAPAITTRAGNIAP